MHKQHEHNAPAPKRLRWKAFTAVVSVVMASAACTPALNWREVTVDRLKATLPCKPDRAQRPVVLLDTTLSLDMAGCEAAGALFAVSHARAPSTAVAQDLMQAWQIATLENMKIQKPEAVLAGYRAAVAAEPPVTIAQAVPLQAQGTNPQGTVVQASLVWFVAGADIYHLAVYASGLKPDMVEPLLTQARIQ